MSIPTPTDRTDTSHLTLAAIVEDSIATGIPTSNHALLLYGPPKAGKTQLAASIAEDPKVDRVFWFDLENGAETIIEMVKTGVLSKEAAAKIILIRMADTRANPIACVGMIKVLNSKRNAIYIHTPDGAIVSKPAPSDKRPILEFKLSTLTARDVIVIDTLSQLGESALNQAIASPTMAEAKATHNHYGSAGKWLGDILTIIQQATYCHFICLTQELPVERVFKDDKGNVISSEVIEYLPLCGSSKMSTKVAKHFGTVIHITAHKQKGYTAGSTKDYGTKYKLGSRYGIDMAAQGKNLTLKGVLIR